MNRGHDRGLLACERDIGHHQARDYQDRARGPLTVVRRPAARLRRPAGRPRTEGIHPPEAAALRRC
jgi:hypothetical protein